MKAPAFPLQDDAAANNESFLTGGGIAPPADRPDRFDGLRNADSATGGARARLDSGDWRGLSEDALHYLRSGHGTLPDDDVFRCTDPGPAFRSCRA